MYTKINKIIQLHYKHKKLQQRQRNCIIMYIPARHQGTTGDVNRTLLNILFFQDKRQTTKTILSV